jgi:WD repeat-containing protein mio
MYLESIDQEEVPWGAALKLDRVIMTEKGVHIKQLRYSREHRGHLGVLSSAGQLQVLKTAREYVEPGSVNDIRGAPELLEVKKSIDLEYASFDPDHIKRPEERIVSFDWLNLGTPELDPRIVGLRSNGTFEILQLPAATAGQLSQLVPWKPPRQCM